jgi:hypothetical protein
VSVRASNLARLAAVLAVAALVLTGCGDDSGSESSGTAKAASDGSATSTTASAGSAGKGDCYSTPGKQKARVRFVNLFTNATYPAGSIDVYEGSSATDPCGKKLATVPFGSASDYIDVTALSDSGSWTATAYIAGSTDDEHRIIDQGETWSGGEAVTIVFAGTEPSDVDTGLPPSSGSVQAFFENGDSPAVAEPPAGKAALGIAATSLQSVDPDGAWRAGVSGQAGCLMAEGDTESTSTSIGGTQIVTYPIDPGSLSLGLFPSDPGTCTDTPAIGPVTVDAAPDSRTFVFAYGSDMQSEKLLVLPIESTS